MLPWGPRRGARKLWLAQRYAPIIYQRVEDPVQDALTFFTYDGNAYGGDNWDNLYSHPLRSIVYYGATETNRHYFIYYLFYHPRDWCERGLGCDWTPIFPGLSDAHENDLEGIMLVVDKLRTNSIFPDGVVVLMETNFHGQFRAYKNGAGCGHNYSYPFSGDPVDPRNKSFRVSCMGWQSNFWTGEPQPTVFVEPRGHGVLNTKDPDVGPFNPSSFPGYIYQYGQWASTPDESPNDRVSYDLKWFGEIEGFGANPNWKGLWDARLSETQTYENVGTGDPVYPYGIRYGFSFVRSGAGQDPDCGASVILAEIGCAAAPWGWLDGSSPNFVYRGEWFNHGAWTTAWHFTGPQLDFYISEVTGRTDLRWYLSNMFTSECQPFQACADTGTSGGDGRLAVSPVFALASQAGHVDLPVPPRLLPGFHWNSPAELGTWQFARSGKPAPLRHGSEIPTDPEELAWANTQRQVNFARLSAGDRLTSPSFGFDPEVFSLIVLRLRSPSGGAELAVSVPDEGGASPPASLVHVGAGWSVEILRIGSDLPAPTARAVRLSLEVQAGDVDIDFARVAY